jgi:serine/threonine protein phosphatase PrpC
MKVLIIFTLVCITILLYHTIMINNNTTIFSIKGKRTYMEDTFCNYRDGKVAIYGVFDGHGGEEVSDILKDLIPNYFRENVFNTNNNIKEKIENAFIDIESILRKNISSNSVGSTACIIVKNNNKLYSINLGDSRLILFKSKPNKPLSRVDLIVETTDHKPNTEKKRIERNKGKVIFDGNVHRVNGNLAISRAFGDFYLKYNNTDRFKGPVSIKPDIYVTPIDNNYNYNVVIGSDGVWDVLDADNIIDIYNHCINKNIKNISDVIGAVAYKNGSTDNITVLTSEL